MATYERICENPNCPRKGEPFTAYRRDKRFCCDSCRKAAWKDGTGNGFGNGSTEAPEYVTRAEFEALRDEVKTTNQKLDEVNANLEKLTGFFLAWFENQTMASPIKPAIKAIPQVAPLDAPVFDEDYDFEVKQVRDTASVGNFIGSMLALQA